jgi:hypothetical protein
MGIGQGRPRSISRRDLGKEKYRHRYRRQNYRRQDGLFKLGQLHESFILQV